MARKTTLSDKQIRDIEKMYAGGFSPKAISAYLGVSESQARHWGIPGRKQKNNESALRYHRKKKEHE